MKTAFSSFIYSRKGIYGILHVLILCLSLFLNHKYFDGYFP